MATIDAATIATTVVVLAKQERFRDIERLFAPRLRAVVSAAVVRDAWAAELNKNGPVTLIGEPTIAPAQEGLRRVSVPVSCERGGLTVIMSVDGNGKLHGLRLAAPATASWLPPSYADSTKFDEREITIGASALAVTGTLSLPREQGSPPGVVLLSGGGPFDRDATSGVNKPLKDLAWGLASRGIAVLRFDKVSFAHSQQVAAWRAFTATAEYVPYAADAIHILQQQPHIDPARIFVLGHSMGGKFAPRVAIAAPSVAGLVIMAGDTQPMARAAVRVARYLARLYPDPQTEAAVETLTRQAALVEHPALSAATPASAVKRASREPNYPRRIEEHRPFMSGVHACT